MHIEKRLGLTPLLKVGLLQAHGRKFGQMPFLPPPVTDMGTSESRNKVCWAQLRCLNCRAMAPPYILAVDGIMELPINHRYQKESTLCVCRQQQSAFKALCTTKECTKH